MSKSEILTELPSLTPAERQEIRLQLARLAAYEKDPQAGSSWEEVEANIRARLRT